MRISATKLGLTQREHIDKCAGDLLKTKRVYRMVKRLKAATPLRVVLSKALVDISLMIE